VYVFLLHGIYQNFTTTTTTITTTTTTGTATEIAHSLGIVEARDMVRVQMIRRDDDEDNEIIIIFAYDSTERFHSINLASHFDCLDLDGLNGRSGELIRDTLFLQSSSSSNNSNGGHEQQNGEISAAMPFVLKSKKKFGDISRVKIGFYRFKGPDVLDWMKLINEKVICW